MTSTSQKNNSLIIGWRLQGRHVLIIGGNQIAANRIEFALIANPRKITLITPHSNMFSDKVREHIAKKKMYRTKIVSLKQAIFLKVIPL